MTKFRGLVWATVLVMTAFAFLSAPEPRASAVDDQTRRRGQDHVVPRSGYHLSAREYPGTGPAFVLMHGFPDNSHLYDRLVPAAA